MNNNNNNNRVDNDTKQNNARAIEADKVCRNLISTDGQYSNFSSIGIQLHQNNYIGCDLIFHQLCWEVRSKKQSPSAVVSFLEKMPAWAVQAMGLYPAGMCRTTPLHIICSAVSDGSKEVITKVLESVPESIHLMDWKGRTPLHQAVLDNNVEAIEVLVARFPNALLVKTQSNFMPYELANTEPMQALILKLSVDYLEGGRFSNIGKMRVSITAI